MHAIAAAGVVLAVVGAAGAVEFHGLGDYPGKNRSDPALLSGDGGTVYGFSSPEKYLWTEATGWGQVWSVPPPLNEQDATDLAFDGSALSGNQDDQNGDRRGFKWTPAGGIELLALPSGVEFSAARVIAADGSAVGGWTNDTDFRTVATVWPEPGNPVVIDTPSIGLRDSSVNAISDDGQLVAGIAQSPNAGFLWSAEDGVSVISPPAGYDRFLPDTFLSDGSLFGDVVATGSNDRSAARWTPIDGVEVLGGPPVREVTDDLQRGVTQSGLAFWDAAIGEVPVADLLVLIGLGDDLAGWELNRIQGLSDTAERWSATA